MKLGIIGGMGPLATSYFMELIIRKTDVQKDQEHIEMVVLNDTKIPDRTKYILGYSDESPLEYLLNDIKILENLNVNLIAIPCNTSMYFYDKLKNSTNIPVMNIVDEAGKCLEMKNAKKVMLLATEGTIKSRIYHNLLGNRNIEVVSYPDTDFVMDIIYNYVKKNVPVPQEYLERIDTCISDCDYVILGCTELSILKDRLTSDKIIDPLEVVADKIVEIYKKGEVL